MDKLIHVRTRGTTMKRLLVLLAFAAAGIVASVPAAQAAIVSNETVSEAWSGFVACANGGAGEELSGWIEAHHLSTSTVNDHVWSYQLQFQPRGSLVGSITGDTYHLTGVTRVTYKDIPQSGVYTWTAVYSYQLIGPGPGNNLRLREIAHVTVDGDHVVVDHDGFSIECK
jgi:hypothetical protein